MAILTQSGRAALIAALVRQPIHLAWGSGNSAWDTQAEPEPIDAVGLVNEIGRRLVTQSQFVQPDEDGEIVVPTGRFTASPAQQPSNHLYLRFNFDFADAPQAVIREIGIFVNTTFKSGLPTGQRYFTLAQIDNPGILLALERIQKFNRSPAVRQTFEFVLTV